MKPKVDWELLEEHHEGLIVTSGCLGGQVLQALMNGDGRGALKNGATPEVSSVKVSTSSLKSKIQDLHGRGPPIHSCLK